MAKINKKNVLKKLKFAIQINGKTRDIIKLKKNFGKKSIEKIIRRSFKSKKIYTR